MSRIYFHSEHGESAVLGAERAGFGILCGDLLVYALQVTAAASGPHRAALRHLLPPDSYVHGFRGQPFLNVLATHLRAALDGYLLIDGERVAIFDLALNTTYVLGSDPVKLAARLHGQCEIHCYVEGPHRAWLAAIIAGGRRIGLFRPASGWEETITLLRSRADGPVVCSYSVCEPFPSAGLAWRRGTWAAPVDADGQPMMDAWADLSAAEQWQRGMAGLRSQPLLELNPERWATYFFEQGQTGFDALAWATAQTDAGVIC